MNNQIAIEASNIIENKPTGIPNYSRKLINHLLNIPEFSQHNQLTLLLSVSRLKKRDLCPHFEGVGRDWYIKNFLLRNNYNLIHYTGVFHNHNKRIPKIVTIHDVAVLKQEHAIPFYTSRETIDKTLENMDCIAKNVEEIIFVSDTTKQDFLNLYPFPENKTSVVYPGSNFSGNDFSNIKTSILEKHRLKSKHYFLFVGGISIRKNNLNLIKAFVASQNESDFDLVLTGPLGMGQELILKEIQLQNNKRIKMTGFVTDSEIIDLFQNAGAFVFPTYYEGFGVPIIDAMNCGIPALIGNRGAAKEIANGYATVVDPFEIDSIAEGMVKVLQTEEKNLSLAREYAKNFTWQRCANETLEVYRHLL